MDQPEERLLVRRAKLISSVVLMVVEAWLLQIEGWMGCVSSYTLLNTNYILSDLRRLCIPCVVALAGYLLSCRLLVIVTVTLSGQLPL
ncbi:uncharacterized protein BDW47DRAFT_13856 [Aspergillus candidus]|uniref:Uncharacterized protein n=1 Tax=Aspergillus candidus TaxID=41067 RepID=A0A2I2FFZ9_ASPCN|nr:hypothetical protein BDW47DRAFT_13856 [Aspergillus candidus]PLB39552.1 hypothetical protein BDW47DRAFT_13856 [Aspergillus candidus]